MAAGGSFDDVSARLQRAQDLRREIRDGISNWHCEFTVRGGYEKDGWYNVRWVDVPEPPKHLALPMADMLHNLQSALDFLVWQLVLANGHEPDWRNSFPLVVREAKWSAAAASSLRGVADEWVGLIRRLQPFHDEQPDRHPLAVLNTANNITKHRLLMPAIFSTVKSCPPFRTSLAA